MKPHRGVGLGSGSLAALHMALLCQFIHQSYIQNRTKYEEYRVLWCSLTWKHSPYWYKIKSVFHWAYFPDFSDIIKCLDSSDHSSITEMLMRVMLSLLKKYEMHLNHPLSPRSCSVKAGQQLLKTKAWTQLSLEIPLLCDQHPSHFYYLLPAAVNRNME